MTMKELDDGEYWRAASIMSQRYRHWIDKMPHIPFNPEWDVRAIPPFAGAMVRYRVMHDGARVSIYMDAYDQLGVVGEPYWEIYPDATGEDCDRYMLADTDALVSGIAASLAGQIARGEMKKPDL